MLAEADRCPAEQTIADFVDGNLEQEGIVAVERHIGVCDACRDLVGEMAKLTRDDVSTTRATTRRGPLRLPTIDSGSYSLLGEIARGGMGRILEAWDCAHQRTVALKVALGSTEEARARMEREIAITAGLSHPSIIPLYAAGRWEDGAPFFAMKRVEGRSFSAVVADAATPKEKLAQLPHLLAVIEALAYAHERGVVHRDVKPSNVLVGAFGETIVIDWGLAKEAGEPAAGHAVGTPSFMPPEQARGEPVDARADVYALGALLYYLLTGVPPHAAPTAREAVQSVLAGPPVPIAERAPDAPADLVTLVEKAMAREPDDRYPTAAEMAADLRRFMTGQLVSAHSYSPAVLLRRWAARHKAALSIAAVSLLLVATLSALGLRGIVRERDRADAQKTIAEREQHTALVQRDAAEQLVSWVITTLRGRLETLGRLDLLRGVGQEVDRYYEKASAIETLDAPALVRRAIALQSLASVETARLDGEGAAPLYASAQHLLEQALARAPGDLDAEVELVHVHVSQAGALIDLGRYDEALAHAERAIEVGRRAVDEHPAEPRALAMLSRGELRKALVLREAGHGDQVAPIYVEACALLDRATAAAPNDLELQRQLGWAYLERGDTARMRGDDGEALPALQRSVEVREKLLAADPGASRRRDLAWSVLRASEVKARIGDRDGALAGFQRVLSLREELFSADPENPSLQRDVMISLRALGNFEHTLGRSEDAIAHGERALAIADALAKASPDAALRRADLGAMLVTLAYDEVDAHRPREALPLLLRAQGVLAPLAPPYGPDTEAAVAELGVLLANARMALGDVTGALADAQRAVERGERRTKESPTSSQAWVALGEAHEILGEVAAARGDAAGAVRAYRAGLDALARAEALRVDPIGDAERAAAADLALARALEHTPGGGAEARELYAAAVKALEPIADRATPDAAKKLAEARAALAR